MGTDRVHFSDLVLLPLIRGIRRGDPSVSDSVATKKLSSDQLAIFNLTTNGRSNLGPFSSLYSICSISCTRKDLHPGVRT